MQAVVNGADMNACCMGQPATDLIRDTNNLAGGANSEPPSSTADLTALHFACQVHISSSHLFLMSNKPTVFHGLLTTASPCTKAACILAVARSDCSHVSDVLHMINIMILLICDVALRHSLSRPSGRSGFSRVCMLYGWAQHESCRSFATLMASSSRSMLFSQVCLHADW